MPWQALPDGETIAARPGYFYAVVASVKASHSKADIVALAHDRGLEVFDFGEEGERAGLGPDPRSPDYRYVAAQAYAAAPGKLPWSVPWPASMLDSSEIVSAWESPPGQVVPVPPAPSPRAPSGAVRVALWPLALLAAGAGVLSFVTRRRARLRRGVPQWLRST